MHLRTYQRDRSLYLELFLVPLKNLRVDSGNDENHVLRGLLPHMREHVFKRLHVLRGATYKMILAKTRNIDLSVPLVLSVKKLLMDLVSLFDLVFGLLPDSSDTCDSVTDPLHVAEPLGFGLDDGFHFAFGVKNAHYVLDGGLLSA